MERSPLLADWRHCPRCAGRLEVEARKASCTACSFTAYANPAPTASALLLDGHGRVLLARRAAEPGAGKWDLLGGFVDEGEEGVAALRRELREETGLEVEPLEFVGAFPDRYGDGGIFTFNLYWIARADGEPRPADDVAEVAWFAPDELPAPEEFAFPNTVAALEAWRAQVRSARPGK